MERFFKVDSSNIDAVKYAPATKVLIVKFKSKSQYAYNDVDTKTVDDFLGAESQGKFFNANIKDKFRFAKIK